MKVTASIVTFNTDLHILTRCIDSLRKSYSTIDIYIVDNNKDIMVKEVADRNNLFYYQTKINIGYGSAHNIAIRKSIENNSTYHIVINPDVYFQENVIKELVDFMENEKNVGLVSPKVLYADGGIQYLCKQIPTPFILFLRRFIRKDKWISRWNNIYELRHTGYKDIMEVPNLSGCFMFFRVSALQNVGLFDEKFFMYMEDTDLSRRVNEKYKTVLFPKVFIYHDFSRRSHYELSLTLAHIKSAIYYFNKWGWFFDSYRNKVNKALINGQGFWNQTKH